MERVRCGIIGIKGVGRVHIGVLRALPNVEVTALVDLDSEYVRRKASDVGARAFTDYKDMLEARLVDAVTVATPHHLHAEIGMACMEAGVHVLMEKPLANRASEVDAMLAIAKANKLKLGVLHQYRTHRSSRVLKQMIDSGKLGKIRRVQWSWVEFRPEKYYTRDPWRSTWEHAGGGVLMNQVSHDLDLMCWLFGQPVQVSAMIANQLHQTELEDIACANILFENGIVASFHSSINQPGGTSMRQIAGEKGTVLIKDVKSMRDDGEDEILLGMYEDSLPTMSQKLPGDHDQPAVSWQICPLPPSPKKNQTLLKRIARRFDRMIFQKVGGSKGFLQRSEWLKWSNPVGHYALIRNFIEAILSDKPLMISGEDGLRTIELINAIILSGVRGEVVKLPLDRDVYDTLFAELKRGDTKILRLR